MPNTEEVLVVGARPVGLVAACQLARLGVHVRVIDALPQRTTQSRAVGIQARSLEMLASLGVLPRLEGRGRRMRALDVVSGRTGGIRARLDLETISSRYPYVLDVAQPDTEAVLEECATELGVVIQRSVELTALAQDGDGVDVTVRSSAEDWTGRFGWVVGADGGHVTTRHLLGARLEGAFQGHHFAMAEAHVDTSLPPDAIRAFLHPDGTGFLFPLAGSRARILFFVDAPEPGVQAPTLEQVRALADTRMGGLVQVRDSNWLTYFEVHHAQVPHYRHGRVLLAGDAAHVHSPIGAQGMNTGIQDAANLSWKLALVAQGRADAALLDTYQDERHPVGATVVRNTTIFTTVQDGGHRHGGVRAGDHAPDPVGLQRADGTSVSIEELLLAHPGLLLVVRSADSDAIRELRSTLGDLDRVVRFVGTAAAEHGEPADWVVDADDAIGKRYGLGSDGLALIRPDGYLGLVASPADPAALRRHLRDALRVLELSTV